MKSYIVALLSTLVIFVVVIGLFLAPIIGIIFAFATGRLILGTVIASVFGFIWVFVIIPVTVMES